MPSSLFSALLASLASVSASLQDSNTLQSADSKTRALLLTLHCILHNDLLASLDVLDRRLVTRLMFQDSNDPVDASEQVMAELPSGRSTIGQTKSCTSGVYFVRLSQQSRGGRRRASTDNTVGYYEVRLRAWNCSCPAFVFNAFRAVQTDAGDDVDSDPNRIGTRTHLEGDRDKESGELRQGGSAVPICKHLLACLLVDRCVLFESYVENRVVERDEMIGWTAGWV
ncbi:MAG: hypothetical protein MMC23_009607 [Stictis urceolatum]|nr:hypothetical protein [Stictis urceolata]